MKKTIMVAGLLLLLGSCYNDKYDKLYPVTTTTCDTTIITYAHDIAPIIVANCYSPGNGCHDAAGALVSGFDYESSVISLQVSAANGVLLDDINWVAGSGRSNMPKNTVKLDQCSINKITRWVHLGAQNN